MSLKWDLVEIKMYLTFYILSKIPKRLAFIFFLVLYDSYSPVGLSRSLSRPERDQNPDFFPDRTGSGRVSLLETG